MEAGGHDTALFVEEPLAAWTCVTCHDVMKQAVSFCDNGHSSCRGCVTDKCPQCRTAYCSVTCFKSHKGSAACAEAREALLRQREAGQSPLLQGLGSGDGKEDEGYRVTPDQLDRMVESKRLQEWLRDPMLREVIELVDASGDRERALDTAVGSNEQFSEFVRVLAETINPEGAPT